MRKFPEITMYSENISHRIFIVGCPRSGTTLFQSMLLGHRDIYSFPETHFFSKGFGGKRSRQIRTLLGGYYAWLNYMIWRYKLGKAGYYFPIISPSGNKGRIITNFINSLDVLAIDNQAKIWAEKTPAHLYHIDIISRYVPKVIFIHLIRDGRAVTASLIDVYPKWGKEPTIGGVINRWNESISITMKYYSLSNHVVIQYEELVRYPEKELNKICNLLNVRFDNQMLSFKQNAAQLILGKEKWKSNVYDDLYDPGLSKFEKLFTETEQKEIIERLNWSDYKKIRE